MSKKKKDYGACLLCDETVEGGGRGLCSTHYRKFLNTYNRLKSESQERADMYENVAIEKHWVNAKNPGGRPKASDDTRFEELAAEISALRPMSAAADALEKTGRSEGEELQRATQYKPLGDVDDPTASVTQKPPIEEPLD